jgi:hypothetical protein
VATKKTKVKKQDVEKPTSIKVSLEVYCEHKSLVPLRPGMRTHTDLKEATIEEWDKAFESYY